MLRALSHQSLRAAQASIIELGRALDNCRSSHPRVDLEGAVLEDGLSVAAGDRLVAQLSNPAFVRTYDGLLVTELAEGPPTRTYVAEEAAFRASSSAAEAGQPERSIIEDIEMAEGAAGPGPVGPRPCTPRPSPFEPPPSSASKRKRRSLFFILGRACLSIGFIDDEVSP